MKTIFLSFWFLMPFGLSAQKNIKAYVFVAEECPICCFLGTKLKTISETYDSKVDFYAVFPQRRSNYKTASLFKKKYALNKFEIILDRDQVLTEKYNATVTPEVIIVNANDEILYQGRINNAYASPGRMRHGKVTEDLEMVLQKLSIDMSYPKPWADAVGCYITRYHEGN